MLEGKFSKSENSSFKNMYVNRILKKIYNYGPGELIQQVGSLPCMPNPSSVLKHA